MARMCDWSVSRHCRSILFRSTARADTFLDTTLAIFGPSLCGRGAMESEKKSPCTRSCFDFSSRTKSARESRNFLGIALGWRWAGKNFAKRLHRKLRATLSATAAQHIEAGSARAARSVPVRLRSLTLLWLPCSFHADTIRIFFILTTPGNIGPWPSENLAQRLFNGPQHRAVVIGDKLGTNDEFEDAPQANVPRPHTIHTLCPPLRDATLLSLRSAARIMSKLSHSS